MAAATGLEENCRMQLGALELHDFYFAELFFGAILDEIVDRARIGADGDEAFLSLSAVHCAELEILTRCEQERDGDIEVGDILLSFTVPLESILRCDISAQEHQRLSELWHFCQQVLLESRMAAATGLEENCRMQLGALELHDFYFAELFFAALLDEIVDRTRIGAEVEETFSRQSTVNCIELEALTRREQERGSAVELGDILLVSTVTEESILRCDIFAYENQRLTHLWLLSVQILEDLYRSVTELQASSRANDQANRAALILAECFTREHATHWTQEQRLGMLLECLIGAAVRIRVETEGDEARQRRIPLARHGLITTEFTERQALCNQCTEHFRAIQRSCIKSLVQIAADYVLLERNIREELMAEQNSAMLRLLTHRVATWRVLRCSTVDESAAREVIKIEEMDAMRSVADTMKTATRVAHRRERERLLRLAAAAVDSNPGDAEPPNTIQGSTKARDTQPQAPPGPASDHQRHGAFAGAASALPVPREPALTAAAETTLWMMSGDSLIQAQVGGVALLRSLSLHHRQDRLLLQHPDTSAQVVKCVSARFKEPCHVTVDHLCKELSDAVNFSPTMLRVRTSALRWMEMGTSTVTEAWRRGISPAVLADTVADTVV
jgi:hypothetical protein